MLGLILKIVVLNIATGQSMPPVLSPNLANGEAAALDPARGNCNACHQLPNTPKATGKSKLSTPLRDMRKRFSDTNKLRALIWDATQSYPQTIMPPYGKHRILSEVEIDDLTAWLLTQ